MEGKNHLVANVTFLALWCRGGKHEHWWCKTELKKLHVFIYKCLHGKFP